MMKAPRFLVLLSAVALLSNFLVTDARSVAQSNPASQSSANSTDVCADRSQAVDLVRQGVTQRSRRNYSAAHASFEQALEVCSTLAVIYYQQGGTYAEQRLWERAIASYSRAIQLYPAPPENPGFSLAEIYERRGDAHSRGSNNLPDAARRDYAQAADIYRQSEDRGNAMNLGRLYRKLEQFESAVSAYRRAIELDSNGTFADAHYNLGMALVEQARRSPDEQKTQLLEEASIAFSTAIDLWQQCYQNPSSLQRDLCRNNLSTAYESRAIVWSELNQPERAQEDNQASLTTIRGVSNEPGASPTELATDAIQAPIDQSGCFTVSICVELGGALRRQGDRQAAIAAYTRAIALIDNDTPPSVAAMVYNNRGVSYAELNNADSLRLAIQDYERAYEVSPTMIQLINLGRALTTLAIRDRANQATYQAQANEAYRRIKDLLEESVSKVINTLPVAIDSETLLNALLVQEQGYEVYRELAVSLTSIQDYYAFYIDVLMQLHEQSQRTGNTTDRYDVAALEAVEQARARGFLELLTSADVFSRIGDRSLAQQERVLRGQFQALVEQWKQLDRESLDPQSLQDLLERDRLSVASEENASTFSCEGSGNANAIGASSTNTASMSVEAQREVLWQQLRSCMREYEQLWTQINTTNLNFARTTRPEPLDFDDANVRRELLVDNNTLMLEYWLGEQQSYLWLVSPTGVKTYKLPGRDVIESTARQFLPYLTVPSEREKPVAAARQGTLLSQMLLGCVADQLRGQRLLIVADGALRYIPFNALPVPTPTEDCDVISSRDIQIDPGNLPQPLLTRHEIVNLPSASALDAIRQRNREPRQEFDADEVTIAVIADPIFELEGETSPPATGEALVPAEVRQQRFPRLPRTRQEAERIRDIAQAEGLSHSVFLGFAANRDTVRTELEHYDIIHFATHGFLDDREPGRSGLVLSQVQEDGSPQGNNGFLSLQDTFALEPYLNNVDLIVLSGCRTGLGAELGGEGMFGLTQGFMYTGADAVIVSLWSVNDEATAVLMSEFYRQLLREEVAPAEALTQAQRRLLNNEEAGWQNPYYWAAFTIQGDWR